MADIIIKRHNLRYYLYADDTKLYVSFKFGSDDLLSPVKSSIEIMCKGNQQLDDS